MTKNSLSVVVIALVGGEALSSCVDRLPLAEVECIVVLKEGMETEEWKRRYPSVIVLERPESEPTPVRRSEGLRAASGGIVGFLEDTSWPDESWCEGVHAAFTQLRTVAAGGPAKLAPMLPSRCQALFWNEYGAFASLPQNPPITPVMRVPGNNMAFRRLDLLTILASLGEGLIEGPVCTRILAAGGQIVFHQLMGVTFSTCDQHNARLSTRFHHGRLYAASRVKNKPWTARLFYLAKTPILPMVLIVRGARGKRIAGSSTDNFRVFLWMSLMMIAWSLGEALGAVRGAGSSMSEWR
jgi:hypothetical protein